MNAVAATHPRPRLWRILTVVVGVGVPLGLVAGALRAIRVVAAGFTFAGLIEARDAVNEAIWLTGGFVAIYSIVYWIVRRGSIGHRASHAIAVAVACLPLALALGYALNLESQISPSTVFTPRGVRVNLAVSLLVVALFPLVAFLVDRWLVSPVRAGLGLRVAAFAVLALIAAAVNVGACVPMGPRALRPTMPNVVLIVIDSLRADHVGAYGYGRATSPHIDAFARDAILFRQAMAQGSYTKTSMASLFTSKWPYQHGVYRLTQPEQGTRGMSDHLIWNEATLPQFLAQRGYLTEAWVRSTHVRPEWGFARGFVTYDPNQRSADTINRGFLSRVHSLGARYPHFAYLHYLDVRYPNQPAPPYEKSELAQRQESYDGALRKTDEAIGGVVDALKSEGLYDNSLIVLTGDHGEAFMEHGFVGNANVPYDELIHVPLIVKMPHGAFAGVRVDRQVRHVDVLPTILDVVRIAQPSTLEGCSLLSLVENGSRASAGIGCFAYSLSENADDRGLNTVAVRSDRYKYLRQPDRNPELYDLVADPGERINLAGQGVPIQAVFGRVAAEIEKRRAIMRYRHLLDPDTLRSLADLR